MTARRLLLSVLLIFVFMFALLISGGIEPLHAQTAATASNTATPRPTPTSTTTPVPALQLPDWVRDPSAQVIGLFDQGGSPLLFNAETGERFFVGLSYIREIGWVDAEDGLYLRLERYRSSGADNSEGFNEYVHLQTGELTRFPYGDADVPINRPMPLLPVSNGGDLAYHLTAQAEWVTFTGAGRPNTYQLAPSTQLIITNTTTGEIVYDINLPVNEVRPLTVEWFGGGRFLGIWGNRDERIGAIDYIHIYDMDAPEWERPLFFDASSFARWSPQHHLMLYREMYFEEQPICLMNVENYARETNCDFLQEWEAENQGEIRDFQWSDDGAKIIFTYTDEMHQSGGLCVADAASLAINCPIQKTVTAGTFGGYYSHQAGNAYGYYMHFNAPPEGERWDYDVLREAGLCLINQNDYSVDCPTDRVLPAETYTNNLLMSPDGDTLAVMYTGREWNDGVCFADLQSGNVTCPDGEALYGYIDTYGWSPDGRFFLVMYGGYGPMSDDKSNMMFGIFDVEKGVYRDEGYVMYETSLNGLWRPSLNP